MLCDPLDDLIDQLDAALRTTPLGDQDQLQRRLPDLQWAVSQLLFGSEMQRARIQDDPRFQLVMRQFVASVRSPSGRWRLRV